MLLMMQGLERGRLSLAKSMLGAEDLVKMDSKLCQARSRKVGRQVWQARNSQKGKSLVEGFSVGFGFGSGDGGVVGASLASVMTGKGRKGLVLLEGDLVVGLQLSTLLLSFD